MTYKKIYYICIVILSFFLIFLIVSCGGGGGSSQSTSTESIDTQKLVSETRTIYENIQSKIVSELEDLKTLHSLSEEKFGKLEWLLPDEKADEMKRLMEWKSNALTMIAVIENDLSTIQQKMVEAINSQHWASAIDEKNDFLNKYKTETTEFIETTKKVIVSYQEFFNQITQENSTGPKTPVIDIQKLVSETRTIYENMQSKIESELEDLKTIHSVSEEKVEKLKWLLPSEKADEMKRLMEWKSNALTMIAVIENDLSTIQPKMVEAINSQHWASATDEKNDFLNKYKTETTEFIETTTKVIVSYQEFFNQINE